VLSVKFTNQ